MTDTFQRVADFTLAITPEDIPDATLNAAALMLLDTLGIVIASSPMAAGSIARETAFALYGTGDPALSARMLFDGRWVCLCRSNADRQSGWA